MRNGTTLGLHADPWVNLLLGHVTEVSNAVGAAGLQVERSWLDPTDPRDATIVLANAKALVFDEVTGWRVGTILSGQQGERTVLADVRYVGAGSLPDARELTHRVINGIAAPRHVYRSVGDSRDGFDDALRQRQAY